MFLNLDNIINSLGNIVNLGIINAETPILISSTYWLLHRSYYVNVKLLDKFIIYLFR